MKKSVLLIILLSSVSTFAQKGNRDAAISNLETARQLLSRGNRLDAETKLVAAKKSIDLAQENSETASDFRTLITMGDIYFELSLIWSKINIEKSYEAAAKSYEGYLRANEATAKPKELLEINKQLRNLQLNTYNQAVENYNASNFNVAQNQFILSTEIAEVRGDVDAQQIYVTGMSCDMVHDYQMAYAYYRKCADMDYGDSKLYVAMLNSAILSKNDGWVNRTIAEGKSKFPNDPEFTTAIVNVHLIAEDYTKAEEALQEAISIDPLNQNLHFILGNIYDKIGKTDQAIDSYRSALSIDPSIFEANYGIGALYFNQAADIQQVLNEMDLGDPNEKELTLNHTELLQKSEIYLRKAYEVKPTDYGTVSALMTIYAHLEMMDDYANMKSAMESIKNGF